MEKKEESTAIESDFANKDVWQKPELSVLDVESTKGGGATFDEGTTNFPS